MPPRPALDVASLHRAYAAGSDPSDIVAAIHRRLVELDDPGIFIHLVPQAEAKAAAHALPPFDPVALPLWGVPFAVKDNIDVAGLPTTAACPAFAYRPNASAAAVDKLLAAGAVLIGKTNLDQFATGLVGTRTPYPVPRNVFDPQRIPGGSSSGSAVAVARGLATFALGTDTAGSGRVPAALNGVVGLKPSLGAVSTRGVVPACRTLDCVSVFAVSVEDAWSVFSVMAGRDEADPFSRDLRLGDLGQEIGQEMPARIGVPRPQDEIFFGDRCMESAWSGAKRLLATTGLTLVDIDMTPFYETARLLYDGPWVAERHAAIEPFAAERPEALLEVTRRIIGGAGRFSATDAFKGLYRLAELRRVAEGVWKEVDVLAVPSAPIFPTLAEVAADPIGPNARLGTYTNFVNLLDLAALAIPGPVRDDGLPAGLTLIGPCATDARLAALGRRLALAAPPLGKADSRSVAAPA